MDPAPPSLAKASSDEEHLRLLAIFHYVVAAMGAFFALFPMIHVIMGVLMIVKPAAFHQGHNGDPAPEWFGYFFIVMGLFFIVLGWAAAICTFISGRYLAKKKKRMFSFVVAALMCAFFPFGTALGVFTIIVLSRASVQQLYENNP